MQYSGGQKHFKALLGQYLFPEWKLNVALSMNVVDLILYYFFFSGMATQWRKGLSWSWRNLF